MMCNFEPDAAVLRANFPASSQKGKMKRDAGYKSRTWQLDGIRQLFIHDDEAP